MSGSATAGSAATTARPSAVNASSTLSAEIATRGLNDHLYARSTAQASFQDLGGRILNTPAVGYSSSTGHPYFVAIGTDRTLWIRTDQKPWSRLVTAHRLCRDSPAVSVLGRSIVAACNGLYYGAVWSGTATLPATGDLPQIGALTRNGSGRYYNLGSPSLSRSGTKTYLWITLPTSEGGSMYTHQLDEPAGDFHEQVQSCYGQAGVAGVLGDHFFLGCQNLYPRTSPNKLNYFVGTRRGLDGKIAGPVGVARSYDGAHATFFVTDLHGVVWMKNVSVTGDDSFVRLGGHVEPGVSAVRIGS